MPLTDISNPENIRFLAENYTKTALLRSNWNEKNKEALKKAATLTREEKGYTDSDVLARCIKAGLKTTSRDHPSGAINRNKVFFCDADSILGISQIKKGNPIVDIGLGDPKLDPRLARPDTDLQKDPKMRPVDPEQKEILYKEIPFFGRKVYLNKRKRIIPEDKYYFPETTGFNYGWRMKDSSFGRPKFPEFGHVKVKYKKSVTKTS